tara:strand:+ start:89 stop:499 length:411 start_codon:yes stop_codon:yes gene_type:complete
MKRIILLAVLISIAIGVGIGYYFYNKKVPTLDDFKPDYKISANDLTLAFENDEAAATNKYEDKIIEVTGIIQSIKNDSTNSNIILEADLAMMGGINCSFKDIQDNSIKKGDEVIVKGRCQGYLMDVIMNNCILVEE